MKQFAEYALELKQLAVEALQTGINGNGKLSINAILDDQPNYVLRREVPLNIRRMSGAFFTGKKLANRLLRLLPETNNRTVYCDPACGAGDLLIATCRTFPVRPRLADTLTLWGDRIVGFDLYEEFVIAAKARLVLLAIQRCSSMETSILEWKNVFPHLKCADGSQSLHELASFNNLVVLLNPPFFSTIAPDNCGWAKGKVNSAALFLESCITNCSPSTQVAAILPEVLRSGSRYKKWRELLTENSTNRKEQIGDQFDGWTDINVYLTTFTIKHVPNEPLLSTSRVRKGKKNQRKPLISELFEVKIGTVVPHRDKKIGNKYFYIHARILKPWQIIKTFKETRKHAGTVFKPPFVAVRRTSRPGDTYRAIGTLITGSQPIAVENHLIVILPKDGTLRACRLLLKSLKRKETTNWLDQRIRCRHLTSEAMKEMPIFAARQQNRNKS